jgi:DNA-binding transcriptional LysR family regulator
MVPTAVAEAVREPIAAMLAIASERILPPIAFDPAQSSREFRLIATDLGALLLVPDLLPRLRSSAPHVRLEILPMDSTVFDRLATREADAAFGIITTTRPDIKMRVVHRDHYACALRAGHPALTPDLTRTSFRAASRVVVTSRIDAGNGLDESVLQELPIANVALRIPTYAILPQILPKTDLIAVLPSSAMRALFSDSDVRFVAPPFPLPPITAVMAWHERDESDPGACWFRDLVADVFAAISAKAR